jgi:hypothetical protein
VDGVVVHDDMNIEALMDLSVDLLETGTQPLARTCVASHPHVAGSHGTARTATGQHDDHELASQSTHVLADSTQIARTARLSHVYSPRQLQRNLLLRCSDPRRRSGCFARRRPRPASRQHGNDFRPTHVDQVGQMRNVCAFAYRPVCRSHISLAVRIGIPASL